MKNSKGVNNRTAYIYIYNFVKDIQGLNKSWKLILPIVATPKFNSFNFSCQKKSLLVEKVSIKTECVTMNIQMKWSWQITTTTF